MKAFSLILWVTQFGFSVMFPLCGFLLLGSWLQSTYELGLWIVILCGVLGLLTSIKTAHSCVRAMRREAGAEGGRKEAPIAFNDHE